MMEKQLKELKHGEYFTLKAIDYPKESQVYIKDDYDRSSKKYICVRFTDCLGSGRELKGTTRVFTDFIF